MKSIKSQSRIPTRYASLRTSLRARVAFGVALPVFLLLVVLSGIHYAREIKTLREQARIAALGMADVAHNSITHAMIENDNQHLLTTLREIGNLENILQIKLIGRDGVIIDPGSDQSIRLDLHLDEDEECQACHQFPAETRPKVVSLQPQENTLRLSAPLDNEPECVTCHSSDQAHLGMLLMDVSLSDIRAHLLEDLVSDVLLTIVSTGLISVGIFFLVDYLIVRRVYALQEKIGSYASGDLSARASKRTGREDEIDQLVTSFNWMADEIENFTKEQQALSKIRQQAIVEERERIARELHDGFAQVLGYVNAKSNAIRLMLSKERLEDADRHLQQLESAAKDQFENIREAIIGLRMASQVDTDLADALRDYVEQFNQMSTVNAQLVLPAGPVRDLPPEIVLHLLRIAQESLTNARKHAQASKIQMTLSHQDSTLKLKISDNGQGFSPREASQRRNGNFGLSSMKERAQEIGAELKIYSEIGKGTQITVFLDLDGSRR